MLWRNSFRYTLITFVICSIITEMSAVKQKENYLWLKRWSGLCSSIEYAWVDPFTFQSYSWLKKSLTVPIIFLCSLTAVLTTNFIVKIIKGWILLLIWQIWKRVRIGPYHIYVLDIVQPQDIVLSFVVMP